MIQGAKLKKIFFVLYLTAIHVLASFFVYQQFFELKPENDLTSKTETTEQVVPLPTPVEIPFDANRNLPENPENPVVNANQTIPANQAPANQIQTNPNPPANIEVPPNTGKLLIPVVGIKRENLLDTFTQSRSNGRVHNSIDIMAPMGAPVVAVADGEIARFFDSEMGGITIYQWSADKKYVYYYAHLQKRADNLQEKTFVKQGTLIGYVGDTGNAGPGNTHLHFSIWIPTDPNKYWDGENINPYPLLKDGLEAAPR